MGLRINETVPDFTARTSQGEFGFHDWIGDSWAILFSHPKDFTPVCTTEFGAVAQLADEWARRDTKVIGVSVDGVEDHRKWIGDIETYAGADVGAQTRYQQWYDLGYAGAWAWSLFPERTYDGMTIDLAGVGAFTGSISSAGPQAGGDLDQGRLPLDEGPLSLPVSGVGHEQQQDHPLLDPGQPGLPQRLSPRGRDPRWPHPVLPDE